MTINFSVVVDIKNFSSNRDLDSIEGHRHDLSFFFIFDQNGQYGCFLTRCQILKVKYRVAISFMNFSNQFILFATS